MSENRAVQAAAKEELGRSTDSADARQKPPLKKGILARAAMLLGLIVVTFAVLYQTNRLVQAIDDILRRETKVVWAAPPMVNLKSGPPTMYFDRSRGLIMFRGVMSEEAKTKILGLLPEGSTNEKVIRSYQNAIDEIAYYSQQTDREFVKFLLLLGGFAGFLGVQLRSLVNFIGHACYGDDLDLGRWWPYYVARPAIGFVLGVILVTIVEAGLLKVGNPSNGTLWWVGLAFFAGFGEAEFTQRLRQVSQTLFGENKNESRNEQKK